MPQIQLLDGKKLHFQNLLVALSLQKKLVNL